VEYLKELLKITEQVRELTKENYELNVVEIYVSGFNSWLQHAPIPSRPIWETALFESSILAETSVFLAMHGFYEEACAVLRMLLDGFLTRLYWDTKHKNGELAERVREDGRNTNDYWEWEGGGRDYPSSEKIWKVLLGEDGIKKFDQCHQLKQESNNLLSRLDKYVHGRPRTRHYPGATRASRVNVRFETKHFDEWLEQLRAVFCLVSAFSILQYPELFKTKQGHTFAAQEPQVADRLRNILGSV
jgi:hypothetical protein